MKIYSITDKAFEKYGRVLENPFGDYFTKCAEEIDIPETSAYKPSIESFESTDAIAYYTRFFGEMPVQIGYCWGKNSALNALEWHKNSEVNCALEDMVLLLGDIRLMKDNKFDSSNIEAFLIKKGESVEIYSTTLHFCPIGPQGSVFKSVVILPKGTNTPLANPVKGDLLISTNKWLICHPEFTKQVELGRVVGITGENIIL